MKKEIKIPSVKREWVYCPYCNTKLCIADSDAICNGIYVKCRTCKREIEIVKRFK
jgi:hypothetical protein